MIDLETPDHAFRESMNEPRARSIHRRYFRGGDGKTYWAGVVCCAVGTAGGTRAWTELSFRTPGGRDVGAWPVAPQTRLIDLSEEVLRELHRRATGQG